MNFLKGDIEGGSTMFLKGGIERDSTVFLKGGIEGGSTGDDNYGPVSLAE